MARRSYLGGPQIVEKRPRARRRCLGGCGRSIVTTRAKRLCSACTAAAAALEVGGLVEATTTLVRIYATE